MKNGSFISKKSNVSVHFNQFLSATLRGSLANKREPKARTSKWANDVNYGDARFRASNAFGAPIKYGPDGRLVATPHERQNRSMQALLVESDGLLIRKPNAPAAKAGEPCEVLLFAD